MNENVKVIREGFVEAPTPAEVLPPSDPRPEPALPSQLKFEAPEPEQTLAEIEALRSGIAARISPWPITVHLLHGSIRNNKNELVDKLVFREPKARDINQFGNPTRFNANNELVIEERRMHAMMAQLCGILPPFLQEMNPHDWLGCAHTLSVFFVPDFRGYRPPTTPSS
jgi:hypothetical protein